MLVVPPFDVLVVSDRGRVGGVVLLGDTPGCMR